MVKPVYTLTPARLARKDLESIRRYTYTNHGKDTANAYHALIMRAFMDIREDPFRPGSKERPEIGPNVRSYHISLSRKRAASEIKSPRHFVLYYQQSENEIVVSRVLHDSRDLTRHIPRDDTERAERFKNMRRSQKQESKDRDQDRER